MQSERRLRKDLFGEVVFRPGENGPVIVRNAGKARCRLRQLHCAGQHWGILALPETSTHQIRDPLSGLLPSTQPG